MADHDQTVQGLKGKGLSLLAVIALMVIQGVIAIQSAVALAQHLPQSRVPPIQKATALNTASSNETEKPEHAALTIIKSHHRRLVMKEDIVRMAVGDSEIVSAELVTNRELLLLGVESGRTTLLIWFKSGQLKQYLVIVERDLSVLHAALHYIHPSIGARLAPDRDAVLLTGLVPDASYSMAAEAVARDYLRAGQAGGKKGKARAFVKGMGTAGRSGSSTGSQQSEGEGEVEAAPTAETARIDAEIEPTVAVINLIRVEQLPLTPEEKITKRRSQRLSNRSAGSRSPFGESSTATRGMINGMCSCSKGRFPIR